MLQASYSTNFRDRLRPIQIPKRKTLVEIQYSLWKEISKEDLEDRKIWKIVSPRPAESINQSASVRLSEIYSSAVRLSAIHGYYI